MAGRVRQWAGRLTGFSTPFVGASWTVPPAERDLAAELLARLEDRRVLYNPSDAESPEHCVRSVIEIRHMLSEVLAKLGGGGALADHVRALGAASRRFLDRMGRDGGHDYDAAASWGHWRSWDFQDALGQMRGIFGVHLAIIAARYDLTVRGDLQSILPAETRTDDFGC
jgi:hypothetical protein